MSRQPFPSVIILISLINVCIDDDIMSTMHMMTIIRALDTLLRFPVPITVASIYSICYGYYS